MCYESLFKLSKDIIYETVNQMIQEDRNNEIVDRDKIKRLFRVLEEVDMSEKAELKFNKDKELIWIGKESYKGLEDWFASKFEGDVKYNNLDY